MHSLAINTISNYAGKIYAGLIGIVVLPMFLKLMGPESYGLIGFFTLMQGWMQLLDLGMSPTLGREIARLKESKNSTFQLKSIVKTFETVFVIVAIFIVIVIFVAGDWISTSWLNLENIDKGITVDSIKLMGVIVGLRWVSSLYRSGINAYEAQVWLGAIDIIFSTLKFPGALILMMIYSGNVVYFFIYQLLIAAIESFILARKLNSLVPAATTAIPYFSFKELKRIAPFSLGLAYTSGIWVMTTQLDKLLLSNILTLQNFGYFSLVVSIASGITALSSPIGSVILPRMTALLARQQETEMLILYNESSRLVVCIIAPVTAMLSIYSKELVYAWTGSIEAAKWAEPILPYYVLGNGLLAIISFQYYLQYVHGRLKWHIIYNSAYAVIVIPILFFVVTESGAHGAGIFWLICQIFTFVFWIPFVHHKFAPNLHFKWFLFNFILPATVGSIIILLFYFILPISEFSERINIAVKLVFMGIVGVLGAILISFIGRIKKLIFVLI